MDPAITAGMLIPVMVYLAFRSKAHIHVELFVKVVNRHHVGEQPAESGRETAMQNLGELADMTSNALPSGTNES
ncbi:hypothetical protein [Nocardia aurea]|uniref:Uncharacterized protein n=1 Tax=Nocardia aurea TaxID=2144174 RepID=A0ABV3FY97_9NOCA